MLKCTCIPERKTNKSRFCARLGEEEDINKLTENSFCDFPAQQRPDGRAGGKRQEGKKKGERKGRGKGKGKGKERERERERRKMEEGKEKDSIST